MNNNKKSPNPITQLIEFAKKKARFFRDDKNECYVGVEENGRRNTYPIKSKTYSDSLRYSVYMDTGQIPSCQAVDDAISIISAQIRSSGRTEEVFVRLGHKEDKVFLDLCNGRGEVVAIDSSGWNITCDPGVNFLRPQNMLPLPLPSTSGTLEDLRDFINVPDSQWTLAKHCLIGMAIPGGPYPIDLGAILPQRDECENLLVVCAVSSSHIAYGSIRMEPVFMILGQSATTAAAQALEAKVAIQEIDYATLARQLEADGQVLAYAAEK